MRRLLKPSGVRAAGAAFVLFLCTGACSEPGKDRRGKDLLAIGDKIVAAIEKYRQLTGAYPSSLTELAEKFDARATHTGHFNYERKGADEFRLDFSYTPSWPNIGAVRCSFGWPKRAWSCSGYL